MLHNINYTFTRQGEKKTFPEEYFNEKHMKYMHTGWVINISTSARLSKG